MTVETEERGCTAGSRRCGGSRSVARERAASVELGSRWALRMPARAAGWDRWLDRACFSPQSHECSNALWNTPRLADLHVLVDRPHQPRHLRHVQPVRLLQQCNRSLRGVKTLGSHEPIYQRFRHSLGRLRVLNQYLDDLVCDYRRIEAFDLECLVLPHETVRIGPSPKW